MKTTVFSLKLCICALAGGFVVILAIEHCKLVSCKDI